MKSVLIRSFFGPYFPAFGLNTKICEVNLHIQSECGKIRTKKAPQGYDQKYKPFRTNSLHLLNHQRINLQWRTNVKVLKYNSITWLNVTSFSPCCHNWLAFICFCACIYSLLRIFCLARYRVCVERLPAFYCDIKDKV